MNSIIDGLRQILGDPSFVLENGTLDYAAMVEYFTGAVVLCIVVASVFRIIGKLVER